MTIYYLELSRKIIYQSEKRLKTLQSVKFSVFSYLSQPYNKFKGSYIEVYSGIEFPKHDFQFNYDTKCRVHVAILHHSGLSYKMF